MIAHYCKVNYCRYPDKHTTFGHRCGKCGGYGHGQMECGNDELMEDLRNYRNEILPKLLKPSGKRGLKGLSVNREANISRSDGRASLLKNPPGILPEA